MTTTDRFLAELVDDAVENIESVLQADPAPSDMAILSNLRLALTSLRAVQRALERS